MQHSMSPVLIDTVPHERARFGTPDFDARMDAPENKDLRSFLAYWQSKHRNGRIPSRADIDPVEIPNLLPSVLLIDLVGQPAYDFHYRLLGTSIVDMDGVNYAGSMLSEMVPSTADFHHIWQHHLNAATGLIELRRDSMRWVRDNSRDHVDYEILLLPLRRSGDEIEALIGYVHYCMDNLHRPWSV